MNFIEAMDDFCHLTQIVVPFLTEWEYLILNFVRIKTF